MNNINAIAQAIQAVKSAFPAAEPAELNKILVDLRIIPATQTSSIIESINENIDKLVANEAANNGGNNMNEFTLTGTTTAPTTETPAIISWKAIPEFATLAHTVNDCKANRMTWFKFFTASFNGVGFNNITRFNSQISALCGLYPNDTELRTASEIIGIIGTIIKWGDIDEITLRNFGIIQDTYLKVTTTPAQKTELIAELIKTIEGYADILNEDEHTYNDAISFFGETFRNDCKIVAKLRNISKIGNSNSKSTNAPAPVVNQCTRRPVNKQK